MMKKRIIRATAILAAMSLVAGITARENTGKRGELDAGAFYVQSISRGGASRDIDKNDGVQSTLNSQFNTTLHEPMQIVRNLGTGADASPEAAVAALRAKYGEEVSKVEMDVSMPELFYNLKNAYDISEAIALYGYQHGLADYRWLKAHGYNYWEQESFYHGIKATESMTLKSGQKKKVSVSGAPKIYEKEIQTQDKYASGTRMEDVVYFERPVWTSSNKKVATVDKNGRVKAIKKGKTKIRVKYSIWAINRSPYKYGGGGLAKSIKTKDVVKNKKKYSHGTYTYCYDVTRTCKITVK